MKKDIHPKWYENCQVTCACGHSFELGAAVPEMHVEICSACHPFYTGQEKLIDTEGRVEKFQKRVATATKITETKAKKVKEKVAKEQARVQRPKTLKEMIELAEKEAREREPKDESA